jgi:hypothetical protein
MRVPSKGAGYLIAAVTIWFYFLGIVGVMGFAVGVLQRDWALATKGLVVATPGLVQLAVTIVVGAMVLLHRRSRRRAS